MGKSGLQQYLESLPEWNNQDKLSFLFAEFPEDSMSDSSFSSALQFWTHILKDTTSKGYLTSDSQLSFNTYQIQQQFMKGRITPLGLGRVLEYLTRNGDLVELNILDQKTYSSSSMLYSLAVAPMKAISSWILSGTQKTPLNESKQTLLFKTLLEKASEGIQGHLNANSFYKTDRLINMDGFIQLCDSSAIFNNPTSAADADLLLKYMQLNKRLVFDPEGHKVIAYPSVSVLYKS